MPRPFRFACQFAAQDGDGPVEVAQRAEAAGFDLFSVSDHVGPGLAPLPVLGAVAHATSTIRLGTFVLNATMRNPVQLAWEASTMDTLSDGRFELGLGAGHTPHEYDHTGIERLPATDRKRQLAEQVEIIRALLDGETVDHDGSHHQIRGATVGRSVQEHLPILVGGNGAELLAHAGAHADIIGLQGLGRTLEGGHRHDVKWTADHLGTQLEQVRAGADQRFDDLELNALVQVMEVTDEPERVSSGLIDRVEGVTAEDLAATPYALIGTVDEIVAKLQRCRSEWGITYFTVREVEAFAPVIEAVAAGPQI